MSTIKVALFLKFNRIIFCLFLKRDIDIYEELMYYYYPIDLNKAVKSGLLFAPKEEIPKYKQEYPSTSKTQTHLQIQSTTDNDVNEEEDLYYVLDVKKASKNDEDTFTISK